MEKLCEYLTVKQAAEYLGVAANTLRNWGKSGKINERRHPVNGYRLYATKELAALLGKAQKTTNRTFPKRKLK